MDLCITEKNEVAKDVRAAVGGSMRVVACSGHLLGLAEPKDVDERYASMSDMSVLPIVFDDSWPVVVKGTGGDWEDYYIDKVEDIREALAKGPDRVYCAGDADDEGQLIVDEVLRYLGYDPCDGMFWRVVINDNLPANIRRAFDEARPNREFYGNGLAAQARSLADFSFGVNESRLATHELKGQVHVGRVQTPTLGLVVARDRAIENHVERLAYSLAAFVETPDNGAVAFSYSPADEEKEDGKHVFDRSLLDDDAAAVQGRGISFSVSHKSKVENPPLPFNMVTLAAEMSRAEGMTAEQVMDTTQSLRQKKLITYNRTDSQYLKEEHWEQAGDLVPLVKANISSELPCDCSIKSKAFNDSKIQAHHAIIPQATSIDGSVKLSKSEEAVYRAIAERYLVQFLPPRRYTEATSSFTVEDVPGTFKCKAVREDDPGFKRYTTSAAKDADVDEDEQGAGTAFLDAGSYTGTVGDTSVTSKKTAPPKRYTDGTLMTDMSSIAKYVSDPQVKALLVEKDADSPGEKGSIGTTATRAGIIENLVGKGYLERQGTKIVSTELGRAIYDAVPADVRAVDTTARWYMIGKEIRDGKASVNAVAEDVVEGFERHRASRAYSGPGSAALSAIFAKNAAEKAGKPVGTCPLCGRRTVIRGGALRCEAVHYSKDADGKWVSDGECTFFIKKWCTKQFTEKQLENLAAGKTVKGDGFVSKKNGSKFSAKVRLKDDGSGIEVVEFVNDDKKKKGSGKGTGPRRSPRPRR